MIAVFRQPRREEADEDAVFAAAIHKLVFFVAGDENHRAIGKVSPFAVLIDPASSGMDEYFVLPFV
ncbi:MAG: hypothetical protein LJE96_10505 [Deltaproteobacteria bacterium]|nr:hypothetical protein [Deltaproteobacteria bacterium]